MGKIAASNAQAYSFLDDQNRPWLTEAVRQKKRVFDNPYTKQQKADVVGNGGDPSTFLSMYSKIVDGWVGMMYSNKNSMTAIPRGGDPNQAFLWQIAMTEFQRINMHLLHIQQMLVDQITVGIGFMMVDRDDSFNPNMFGTVERYLDFEKCRWSNNYSHPLMDDLDMFVYYDLITLKSAIVRSGLKYDDKMMQNYYATALDLPDSLKQNTGFNLENQTMGAEENRLVPWIEVFRKEHKNYIKLTEYDTDKTRIIRSRLIEDRDISAGIGDSAMSFFTTVTDSGNAESIVKEYSDLGKMDRLKQTRCVKQISIGGLDVGAFTLPTQHYPMVPFRFKRAENSNPVGIMKQLEGNGMAMNHALLLELMQMRTLAGVKWELPAGTVKNRETFVKQISRINGVIDTEPQQLGNGEIMKPNPIFPTNSPMNGIQMIQFLDNYSSDAAGLGDIQAGTYSGSPPSGDAINSLQKYGGLKFRPYADAFQIGLARLANISVDYIKVLSKDDQTLRMLIEDDDLMKQIIESGIPAQKVNYPGFNIEMPMNKKYYDSGKKKIWNDFKNAEQDIDMAMVGSPATDSQRKQWAEISMGMMNQRPEYVSMLGPLVLQWLEVPGAHKIGKNMDQIEILTNQVQDLTRKLKIATGEQVRLMEQNIRSKVTADTVKISAQYKSKLEKQHNDFELLLNDPQATTEDRQEAADQIIQTIQEMESILAQPPSETSEQSAQSTLPQGAQ